MTNFVFNFPFHANTSTPLVCVWSATGNPRQPLACRWIARAEEPEQRLTAVAGSAGLHLVCA